MIYSWDIIKKNHLFTIIENVNEGRTTQMVSTLITNKGTLFFFKKKIDRRYVLVEINWEEEAKGKEAELVRSYLPCQQLVKDLAMSAVS